MKQIDRVEKVTTKWAMTRIKAETLAKVQKALDKQDRGISQQVFIDSLLLKGLGE